MRNALVKFVATGFGSGLVPKAPGTAGTVVGVVLWWGMASIGQPWIWYCFPLLILLAIYTAGETAKLMQQSDPGCVVIDEIVAMPIVLAGCNIVAWKMLVGFAAFRLFDIWKPFPVHQSQRLPGGFGIVIDDLLAAGYAWIATQAIIYGVSLLTPR